MAIDLSQQIAIRWRDPDPGHVSLLQEAGVSAVVAPENESFRRACEAAGIQFVPEASLRLVELEPVGEAVPGGPAVVQAGLWPGTRDPDPAVASATRSVWLDQNCYLPRYIQALNPKVFPVLGYLPDEAAGVSAGRNVRFESLELALAEAWMAGGNYLMAVESRYREALLSGAQNARTAWQRLGRTARWLRGNVSLFRQPALPLITVLVDGSFMSHEIANLCFRHSVSPALAAASNAPPPDPKRIRLVAACGIAPPQGQARDRILAHAAAGAVVVADQPGERAWWRMPGLKLLRSFEDREVYAAGKGEIIAYKEPVSDPGECALDLIDFAGRDHRPARLYNARAAVAMATLAPPQESSGARAALHILNYSQPASSPVLARIHGRFERARLLRPEAEPLELKVARRGAASEVAVPQLVVAATVLFA